MDNKGFEMSFAWLFAIIAGAIILFLAIFAATKVIHLGQTQTGAQAQNQIGILLNPLETGFQSGQVTTMVMPTNTRIYNQCYNNSGYFGKDVISVSQYSLNQWPQPGQGKAFENKYIFSDPVSEGKQFYIFSKPFNFPFKVSDLIYLISYANKYCFINAPSDVTEELSNLNQSNIMNVSQGQENKCPAESIKVCFNYGDRCDVNVDTSSQTVTKNYTSVYYFDNSLMYGAIFSSPVIYECQIKRLMEREDQLISLYEEKQTLLVQEGCPQDTDLTGLQSYVQSFSDSSDLRNLAPIETSTDQQNSISTCRLW